MQHGHVATSRGAGPGRAERCCLYPFLCLLTGTLLPPRDVRLEAQNFHVFLRWEPDLGSPGDAMYEVEWRRR